MEHMGHGILKFLDLELLYLLFFFRRIKGVFEHVLSTCDAVTQLASQECQQVRFEMGSFMPEPAPQAHLYYLNPPRLINGFFKPPKPTPSSPTSPILSCSAQNHKHKHKHRNQKHKNFRFMIYDFPFQNYKHKHRNPNTNTNTKISDL